MDIRGNEIMLETSSLIVSKTDLKGCITYANFDFIEISGYTERELIGVNHNIIRHPYMPKIIFKVLWDTIKSGKEVNAFVINQNKNGLDYWVYANVTPSFDKQGNIVGYYSVRRKPNRKAVEFIQGLYAKLSDIEQKAKAQGKDPIEASSILLTKTLNDIKMDHRVFFTVLQKNGSL